MRSSLTSLGRRLPELAADLAAIADGLDSGEPATLERARTVAHRALTELCAEEGIEDVDDIDSMIEALLAKAAIPYSIATSVRTLFDTDSTMVGDAVRAMLGFLEWRVGSRSRFATPRPRQPRRRARLPIVLGASIAVVGLVIVVVVVLRRGSGRAAIESQAPMIRIAGASFDMGSTDAEREAALAQCREVDHRTDCLLDHERLIQEQLRTVTVSTFELDTYEVTVGDYIAWLDRNPPRVVPVLPNVRHDGEHYVVSEGRERLAVTGVTWNDARAYCEAIGRRLPTEAEWELAARGTDRRAFPWGNSLPQCSQVIYERQEGQTCSMVGVNDVAPIGSGPGDLTPQGIHDLGGNVSEWTADAAGDRPRCPGPCVDPRADAHTKRVVRGGEWNGWGSWTRGASRASLDPDTTRTNLGFRCARTVSPSS